MENKGVKIVLYIPCLILSLMLGMISLTLTITEFILQEINKVIMGMLKKVGMWYHKDEYTKVHTVKEFI